MNNKHHLAKCTLLLLLSTLLSQPSTTHAQGTAFTYQGRLNDGANLASGNYDLRFTIYDAASVGAQQGSTLTNSAVAVSNGLFTVTLDFGNQFPGANRWLEIGVRTNGGGAFSTLASRRPITVTPYAVTANSASNLLGTVPATQLGGTLSLAQLPGGLVTNNQAGVSLSGSFTGDALGLTNVLVDSLVRATTNSLMVAWGANNSGQATVPAGLNDVDAVAAGFVHNLVLKPNGMVAAWGVGPATNVPPGLSGVIAVSAGFNHSVAVRADGTVVAWGDNNFGQTTIPPSWTNIVAIAAAGEFNVALRNNGTVVARGRNQFGQTNVPPTLNGVKAVGAGFGHAIALRTNGMVVAWGVNDFGQTDVPPGLSNVVAIVSGWTHSMALKADGRVVAWGQNGDGQTNVPAGLSNVVAMAAGMSHSLALRSDGMVIAWGANNSGQTNIPAGLNGVIALAPGPAANHAVAIHNQVYSPVAWLDANNTFQGINTFKGDIQVSGAVRSSGFFGNGSGLTNLNATNITSGTLADARLSGNVALLNSSPAFRGQTFSAGLWANANHNGAFVWADSQAANFASERIDQFRARANGGVRFDINAAHWINLYTFLDTGFVVKVIDTSTGAYLTAGGSWVNNSDRASKENVQPVNGQKILDALAALPISSWNYRNEHAGSRHIGPMAQDFHAAFGLNGLDDKHVATIDADGVALAAIQGLNEKSEVRSQKSEHRIQKLEAENTELKARLEKLEQILLQPNHGGK